METIGGRLVSIGIIGAGNAGLTLAAKLLRQGKNVRLYAPAGHVRLRDEIFRRSDGVLALKDAVAGTVDKVKLEPGHLCDTVNDLVDQTDIIYNTTPIFAHEEIFSEVHDAARGRTSADLTFANLVGGFSIFSHMLKQLREGKRCGLATFHTLPFASRVTGHEAALLNVRPRTTTYTTSPAAGDHLSLLSSFLEAPLEEDEDGLHMSLDRSSYVMHPLILLFNANKVERRESWYFYSDGFCNFIQAILIKANFERRDLADRLGYFDFVDPEARLRAFHKTYGADFGGITAPESLSHRYIMEDIPFGLVPIVTLGEEVGLHLPTCSALVNLASAATGQNLWQSPYNLHNNPALLAAFLGKGCME